MKVPAAEQMLKSVEADLQALPVGVFFFALGHDVDHPAGLVAPCAAHALNVADGRRVRVKADNQIYLQGMVLVWSCQEHSRVLPVEVQKPPLTKLWGQFISTFVLAFGNSVWHRVDAGQTSPDEAVHCGHETAESTSVSVCQLAKHNKSWEHISRMPVKIEL